MKNSRDIDRGWKKIIKNINSIDDAYTKVGIQEGAENEDGETIAKYAAANELGTEHIPSRPFMRSTFDKNKSKIQSFIDSQYYDLLKRRESPKDAIAKIGAWHVGQVQVNITQGTWKPNDPATIRAKGSNKPLIDTGTMRASITHVEFNV